MIRRAEAIQKAMKALRNAVAERAVSDALHARNGPTTDGVLSLPLQSEVMVWREKNGWQGPYKVIDMKDHNVTVDMINGPTTFRSTVVKPYYRDLTTDITPITNEETSATDAQTPPPTETIQAPQPRKRGRPRGSKNKPKVQYLSKKEEDDYALAIKLRNDGVINTSGAPFEASDQKEIDDLVGRGVLSCLTPAHTAGIASLSHAWSAKSRARLWFRTRSHDLLSKATMTRANVTS